MLDEATSLLLLFVSALQFGDSVKLIARRWFRGGAIATACAERLFVDDRRDGGTFHYARQLLEFNNGDINTGTQRRRS